MKKFLYKIFFFLLLVIAADTISGKAFAYMVNHAKGGNNLRNNYICNLTSEDILVFGSSRAIHHYNPFIISDSLKMSCYNCGQDGNGSILNFGRIQLINQRYHPKLIIYDVQETFDIYKGSSNEKYLGWLKAYYDREGISDIFVSVSPNEKYKMVSQLYRYNSKFIGILTDFLHPVKSAGKSGFIPLNGEMDLMKVNVNCDEVHNLEIDTLKLQYIRKIISESSKDTKIVFVISPTWNGRDNKIYHPIRELCSRHQIPFVDFSNNDKYMHNSKYFKDGGHLNSLGADEFTKDFVQALRHECIIF